jgi:thioredoxin reductase (NADPH)
MMDAEKDELIAVWDAVVKTTGLVVQEHEEVTDVRRDGEVLVVKTPKGEYRAANVVLAIGTRGNPRRLGCAGEDPSCVSYLLVDASEWSGKSVLVVGGGDSAIEAAVALAKAPGTTVRLSYRKNAFARVKKRNLEQIDELAKAGRIEILFESTVKEVGGGRVTLETKSGSRPIDCVQVFALIGADPPRAWIEKIGVPFVEKEEAVMSWS